MGLEDLANEASDFIGEAIEGIQDLVIDIGDCSKEVMENLGDEGMKAFESGDINRVIACSDMSKENKEAVKAVVNNFDISNVVSGGLKVLGGTIGTIAALATPGFQASGVSSAMAAYAGAVELAEALNSKNASILANA